MNKPNTNNRTNTKPETSNTRLAKPNQLFQLTISGGVGSTFREPRVALGQVHVTPGGGPTIGPQPLDRVREAILALGWAQVPHALRHPLQVPGAADPVQPPGTGDGA
ncbi:hypothetical protein TorRG33x02_322240 [Trema orientale]|uniref:Uncharacterized protein n=1 Tax=Trema orientale TaxID=63057 RepID=A0A2P5BG69_TREOI|nr:hypothetical protein TorRG33x02_322240 [Trema orientale]